MDAQPSQQRIAIVGGGPAGLATASNLLALAPGGVQIDILDKAPTPFGLLRHGVAPDHTHHRGTLTDLATVFDNPAVRFLGLVEMGTDVTRAELLASYDAVVYATGAAEDHLLGVPGEELKGVISSRTFSDWYSRAPQALDLDLSGVINVVIVGLGDVALDVARLLLKSPDAFAATDMPRGVLAHLREHRVRSVTILVRRGPEDCQLKADDLRELLNLPGVDVRFDPAALPADAQGLSPKAQQALPIWQDAASRPHNASAKARLKIRFWTRALELRGRERLDGVRIERTQVDKVGRLVSAGGEDMIPAQLLIRATGYRGTALPAVPFDAATGRIPTRDHRVIDLAGAVQPHEYAAGWIANGWVGGFGSMKRDGLAVAQAIIADARGKASIDEVLAKRGVTPVGIDRWHRLEEAEAERGAAEGCARVKVDEASALLRWEADEA